MKKYFLMALATSFVVFIAYQSLAQGPEFYAGKVSIDKVSVSIPALALDSFNVPKINEKQQAVKKRSFQQNYIVGIVKKIFVEEGTFVKKGEPLFQIENPYLKYDEKFKKADFDKAKALNATLIDGKADIKEAKSKLADAKILIEDKIKELEKLLVTLQKTKRMLSENLHSQNPQIPSGPQNMTAKIPNQMGKPPSLSEINKKEAALKKALSLLESKLNDLSSKDQTARNAYWELSSNQTILEARLDFLLENLKVSQNNTKRALVKAPVSGYVSKIIIREGELATSNQKALNILSNSAKIELLLPLEKYKEVALNQKADVFLDSFSKAKFSAVISQKKHDFKIAPSDFATKETELINTAKVTIKLENKNGVLKEGMPVDVKLN